MFSEEKKTSFQTPSQHQTKPGSCLIKFPNPLPSWSYQKQPTAKMRHFGTPLPPRHFFIIYHSLLKINWNENVWSAYKSCQKGHSRKVVGRARRSWNSEIKGWIWSPLPTWPVFMLLDSYVTATCDTLNTPHNPFWQIWPSHWFWFSRFYMMNGVSWRELQFSDRFNLKLQICFLKWHQKENNCTSNLCSPQNRAYNCQRGRLRGLRKFCLCWGWHALTRAVGSL